MQSGFRLMDVNFPLTCTFSLFLSLSRLSPRCDGVSGVAMGALRVVGCSLYQQKVPFYFSGCGVRVLPMFCTSRVPSRRCWVTKSSCTFPLGFCLWIPLPSPTSCHHQHLYRSDSGYVASCSATATSQVSCRQKIP